MIVTASGVPVITQRTLSRMSKNKSYSTNDNDRLYDRLMRDVSDNPSIRSLGKQLVREYPVEVQQEMLIPGLKMVQMLDMQARDLLRPMCGRIEFHIYTALFYQAGLKDLFDGVVRISDPTKDAVLQYKKDQGETSSDGVLRVLVRENPIPLETLDDFVEKNDWLSDYHEDMRNIMLMMYAAIDTTYNSIWSKNHHTKLLRTFLSNDGPSPELAIVPKPVPVLYKKN